jgi:diguanylate cyclase (GGDEF)-like protein
MKNRTHPTATRAPRSLPVSMLAVPAALFAIVSAVALVLEHRSHVVEAADRDNSNIARLVAFHISHVLEGSSRLSAEVAEHVRRGGLERFRGPEGRQLLVDRASTYPGLQAVALADARGQLVVASALPFPPPDVSFADREYFALHRAGEELVVGEQLTSRALGRRGTTITRAIRSTDGALLGVVVIDVDSAHFTAQFERIRRSPDQAVSVLRLDGAVFARSPEVEVGRRFPDADVFEPARRAPSGTFTSPRGSIDGKPRLIGFERVEGFPLVVVASQSLADVLAPLRPFAAAVTAALAVALTLLGIASVHAYRSAREMEVLHRELDRLARTDALTGVANRRQFTDVAEQELARARRYGSDTAVAIVDLDHFKRVNDTHGHAVGDAVLRHLGERFRDELREIDLVARVGGEEFAVLLPETDAASALAVAERLRRSLGEASVTLAAGAALHVTVSIGVAAVSAGGELDDLLRRADDALYRAKHGGRDRVAA